MAFRGVHSSSLPGAYPTTGGLSYSKTLKPRRQDGTTISWRLVALVLLGTGCLVYTLRSSGSSDTARAARAAAYDKLYPGATRVKAGTSDAVSEEPTALTGPTRKWSERRVRTVLEDEEALRQEAEAATARGPTEGFNSELHRQYLELSPQPFASAFEHMGGWNLTNRIYDQAARHPAARVLSFDNPRLIHFPSFLSPEEVAHMVSISKDHLTRSEVLHEDGDNSVSDIRTSYGHWPAPTPVTHNITDRIHRLVGIPERFGEDMYVLNYKLGQQYEAHNDHCMDNLEHSRIAEPSCRDFLKRARGPMCGVGHGGPSCGDRVATFILVLRHPTKGGHTVFPAADITKAAIKGHKHKPDDTWYCEDKSVLGAAPEAGDALLFWDYKPWTGSGTGTFEDGSADPSAKPVYGALHSGCPILEGEKWIVTRWIRGAGFDYVDPDA